MKNILNNLGGALGGALDGQSSQGGQGGGLADKLQSTLGSVLGGQSQTATGSGAPGNAGIPGLGNLNLGNMNLGGMLGSAAIGGLLGALMGGKGVQKIAKGALVVGGTAAAGALAWKFYQKWSQSQVSAETVSVPGQAPASSPTAHNTNAAPSGWPTALESPQQALPPADNTALLLLEAIIFAARADGHIDEEEKAHIQNAAGGLFPGQDMNQLLEHLLTKPIDPNALAARVRNAEEGRDLYRLSCTVINVDSFMERSYLDGLAQALRIAEADKQTLEREAAESK